MRETVKMSSVKQKKKRIIIGQQGEELRLYDCRYTKTENMSL
jgi:hypothetical protein